MPSAPLTIVADLGGTYIRCAVLTPTGTLTGQKRTRLRAPEARAGGLLVWEEVISALADFAASVEGEGPMAIAVPGPVTRDGILLSTPTLAADPPACPDLGGILERRSGRRVLLLNDLSAAAWYFASVLPDVDRFMVITVGSGIGSKVFDRHHDAGVLDDRPYCGEIGHLVADWHAEALPCGCGGRGHLGSIASGRGIERRARELAARDPERFRGSACGRTGMRAAELTNEEHLIPAARAGDAWSLEVVRECTRPLARVLAGAALTVGLQRIIIVGGFAQALGPRYLEILREEVGRLSDYPFLPERLRGSFLLGDAGIEACLLGAGVFARRAQGET